MSRILAVQATVAPRKSFQAVMRGFFSRCARWLSKLWPFKRDVSRSKGASPMVLPDDILLMIVDLLREGNQDVIHNRGDIFGKAPFRVKAITPSDFLCFSMVNRRLRAVAIPQLFRTIYIGPGWRVSHVYTALLSLEKALPDLRRYTRTCHIDSYHCKTAKIKSPAPSPKRLLQLLQRLDCLEKIVLLEPNFALSGSRRTAQILLPQVKSLVLSPNAGWLIAHCPNVRSIATNEWLCADGEREVLYSQAASARQLEYFCDSRHGLNPRMLAQIHLHMPRLRYLGLSIASSGRRHHQQRPSRQDLMAELEKFNCLEHLALPAEYMTTLEKIWLAPGERAHAAAVYGPDGGGRDEVKAVASNILHALPRLQTLFLGSFFQVRVLYRDADEGSILVELEGRPYWSEWPPPHVATTPNKWAVIETCTLMDHSRLQDKADVLSIDEVIEQERRELALETMTLHGD